MNFKDIIKRNEFAIVIDPQVNENNGYLRSLPLLDYISSHQIHSVMVWEPGENCRFPLDIGEHPLQYYPLHADTIDPKLITIFCRDDLESQFHYVSHLIECQCPKIFVTSHQKFIPETWKISGKKLDDRTPHLPVSFDSLYWEFIKKHNYSSVQLKETKNIVLFQVAALTHAMTGKKIRSLFDLFDFSDPLLSVSPIWDWAIRLHNMKKENIVANTAVFIFNAWRPWIERNMHIDKIKTIYFDFFKDMQFSFRRIQNHRSELFSNSKEEIMQKLERIHDPELLKYTSILREEV